MNECVSIIIPCYNGETTIDRAIRSVFIQDYHPLELIVVDDGSVDGSREKILAWAEAFAQRQMTLRYIHQENKGLGGAINTGLKYVTGAFLMLLDADDEYLSGAVTERLAYFAAHPECAVVRSNGWRVKGQQRFLFVYDEAEKWRSDVFDALLRGETNNWAGSYMVRTEPLFRFYPQREIYTSRFGQNLQLLLPLVYEAPCGFIDRPLMNYILQEGSLSQSDGREYAQEKALTNAAGYRDIREHMVRLIVQDEQEREDCLRSVHGGYWRGIMQTAIQYHDKALLKEAMESLRRVEPLTLHDRISYYNICCPPLALLLRVKRRLHRN